MLRAPPAAPEACGGAASRAMRRVARAAAAAAAPLLAQPPWARRIAASAAPRWPAQAAAAAARGGQASTSGGDAGCRLAPPAGGARTKRASAVWRLAAAATGMPSGTRETLTGEVMVITFQSEESGYTVAKLRVEGGKAEAKGAAAKGSAKGSAKGGSRIVAVVGAMPTLARGRRVRVEGEWVMDKRFGAQLKVAWFEEIAPESAAGILAYLSNGVIKGVGEAIATKMVAAFGERTLEVLDSPHAAAQLAAIPGFGKRSGLKIKKAWDEGAAQRQGMAFLQGLGCSAALAQRAVSAHGGETEARVRQDAFAALAGLRGASFADVDALAAALGGEADAPARIAAGLRDTLASFGAKNGHSYLPWEVLRARATALLSARRGGVLGGAAPSAVHSPPSAAAVEAGAIALVASGALVAVPATLASPGARVYLPEMARAEASVAATLARLGAAPPTPLAPPGTKLRARASAATLAAADAAFRDWLRGAAAVQGVELAPDQADATADVVRHACLLLTGGPGTGKSFVTALAVRYFAAAGKRVRLCAPTGRAAQRLAELLDDAARRGAPELTSLEPPSTVHRLLEYDMAAESGGGGRARGADRGTDAATLSYDDAFVRNAGNPLDLDVLIVDEASMLDLPLAAALLAALPPHAQLILVGDAGQLPPVGPGAVLRDALRAGTLPAARLETVFRQAAGSLIIRAAHAVAGGSFPPLAPVTLPSSPRAPMPDAALPWDALAPGFAARDAPAVAVEAALARGLDALWVRLPDAASYDRDGPPASPYDDGPDAGGDAAATAASRPAMEALSALVTSVLPSLGLRPSRDLQVITPMRRGPHGSAALCTALQPLLNAGPPGAAVLPRGGVTFRAGDRVIHLVNDAAREVYNGDLGRVVSVDVAARRLVVDYGRAGAALHVTYEGPELDELAPAWAVTVHKAQGSEFPAVALLLHAAHGPLLSRKLMYTALSRASKLLVVISAAGPIATAVRMQRDDERYSYLAERVAEAAGAPPPAASAPPAAALMPRAAPAAQEAQQVAQAEESVEVVPPAPRRRRAAVPPRPPPLRFVA